VIEATLYTDPGCPWAYSATPDLAVLRWRYDDALNWRIATIGLAEDNARYVNSGYTPLAMAQGYQNFRRRFGMPFGAAPRARVTGTGRACRAIVATRLTQPELEWAALRALQFAWFASDALLDENDAIEAALATVDGLDAAAIVAALDDPETEAAYQRDRAESRTAAGGPTEAQGKSANTDGAVRFTAPSIVFTAPDGRQLEAGGFQSTDAYDVCIANLDPALPRRAAPEDPYEALAAFPHGLTTQEVAAVMAPSLTAPDREAAQARLLELVAGGRAERAPLGDDALWRAT
jgi:protein-disulfide isomerase-like protein with CxxC motif